MVMAVVVILLAISVNVPARLVKGERGMLEDGTASAIPGITGITSGRSWISQPSGNLLAQVTDQIFQSETAHIVALASCGVSNQATKSESVREVNK